MPRTLPWLINQGNEGQAKRVSTPRKRVKRERTPDDDDATPRKPPTSPDKRDFFRSSQTPPTSPARPCPAQQFLIEGLDHDDAWVMVEDEFYAIAQSFTQHLHYAEYIRRKKEAKAQNAEAINEIQRPTDGRTKLPKEAERKKEAEALAARQKAGLTKLGVLEGDKDDSDDDDDIWAGTHLHGLMTSPRKSRTLVGTHLLKSSTRAAAGFGQAAGSNIDRTAVATPLSRAAAAHILEIQEETASDDDLNMDGEAASDGDDDLDRQNRLVTIPESTRLQTRGPTKTAQPKDPRSGRESIHRRPTINYEKARGTPAPGSGFKSRVQMLYDDLDELPEPSRSNTSPNSDMKKDPSSTNSIIQSGPANDNLESKKSRFNDVPTFLF
ncbi:hypothetical protein PMG11_06985 [Penicillium brasilianum]|uniref:Uncharacterized protein n=1 Tax=Penicillium brasilianum TaxID=104259 RepID=A0A0F7TNK5_PENBI|nr:hypothetical protein PMG11_06985 [Penicillium brasilianum]